MAEYPGIEVRPFHPEEWEVYKATRLRALESDPKFFGSRLDEEKALADNHWQERLTDPKFLVLGVFNEGQPIGMTGVAVDRSDDTGQTGKLWGSWLEPAWRNKGLSRKMYEARISWAKAHPTIKKLVVSHRKSNAVSKRANQRFGFKFVNAKDTVWYNGEKETEFFYELPIK